MSRLLTICLIMLVCLPVTGVGQEGDGRITIGEIKTIYSDVLGEERRLFVSVPAGYDQVETKYPVLFVLDGRRNHHFSWSSVRFLAANNRMSNMIVVSIPNTIRDRDFTPVSFEGRPNSGGADKFLKFLEEELIPYINENYRTYDYRILTGHSLCGMFAVYTLFTKPDLFEGYIAISPYMTYAENYVEKLVTGKLDEGVKELKKQLYITLGDEPGYVEILNRFTGKLKEKKVDGLRWHYEVFPDDNHMSVPMKSVYNALEFIFEGWELTTEIATSRESVINHYKSMSNKFGFEIKPPEESINGLGYRLMGMEKISRALEIFELNIEFHPESANVYDSYAEGLESSGLLDKARINYEKAYQLAVKNKDGRADIFKRNMERVAKKLEKK